MKENDVRGRADSAIDNTVVGEKTNGGRNIAREIVNKDKKEKGGREPNLGERQTLLGSS